MMRPVETDGELNMTGVYIPESKEARAVRAEAVRKFVFNSELIAGRGFEKPEETWQRPSLVRHLDLAMTLTKPGGNFVPIELVNANLNNRSNDWFRTGIESLLRGLVPEGKYIPRLIRRLDDDIVRKVTELTDSSDEEKARYAWEAHDHLICLHGFKEKNGRTARLLLNHVRALLGLPIFVIKNSKAGNYDSHVREYRTSVFLPQLEQIQLETA